MCAPSLKSLESSPNCRFFAIEAWFNITMLHCIFGRFLVLMHSLKFTDHHFVLDLSPLFLKWVISMINVGRVPGQTDKAPNHTFV